jgi:hypothetical protein
MSTFIVGGPVILKGMVHWSFHSSLSSFHKCSLHEIFSVNTLLYVLKNRVPHPSNFFSLPLHIQLFSLNKPALNYFNLISKLVLYIHHFTAALLFFQPIYKWFITYNQGHQKCYNNAALYYLYNLYNMESSIIRQSHDNKVDYIYNILWPI